jgi:hypothetical protein
VPLSTSSSSRRAPACAWGKIWLTASLIVLLVLGAWNHFWQAAGFKPASVRDDADLWVQTRVKAVEGGKKVIVLIGDSRMQLGINLDAFREKTGIKPIQLAIMNNSPIPVLRHLAEDSAFIGTIICGITEANLNPTSKSPIAEEWIRAYDEKDKARTRVFYADFENWLQNLSRRVLVFRSVNLAPHDILRRFLLGLSIPEPYLTVHPDRSITGDYTKVNIAEHQKMREEIHRRQLSGRPITVARFLENARKLEELVARIHNKGGRIIFIRLPSGGKIWQMDEAIYPKKKYWDMFAAHTLAVTLHFKDYPDLDRYVLPDGLHLDYRDTLPFTQALAQILANDLPPR